MITRKEVIRYLGYGQNIPDDRVMELINNCIKEVEAAAKPKNVYRRFDVFISEDDVISVAGLTIESHNLAKNLRGCSETVLFAATLGTDVDRLLNKALKLDIAKAAVIQATAAAAIEDYCNDCQNDITAKVKKEGLYVRPRFSPGYGDFALSHQGKFLNAINATKLIGITLSEGGIMIPEKSVSAIMGLSKIDTKCHLEGCEACGNAECQYRR